MAQQCTVLLTATNDPGEHRTTMRWSQVGTVVCVHLTRPDESVLRCWMVRHGAVTNERTWMLTYHWNALT